MKIKNTKDICTTNNIKALIYAPPKYGKTTLAKTTGDRCLVVSLEAGLLSLRGSSVDYIEVDNNDKLDSFYSICSEIKKGVNYDTIYYDSMSEIADLLLEDAENKFPDSRQSLQKWGHYSKTLKSFVKFARDLSQYNVYFSCLSKDDKDEIGRKIFIPDVAGGLSRRLPQFFDLIMTIIISKKEDEEKRFLLTSASDGWFCGDRSGCLNKYEEMNLAKIRGKIVGNMETR